MVFQLHEYEVFDTIPMETTTTLAGKTYVNKTSVPVIKNTSTIFLLDPTPDIVNLVNSTEDNKIQIRRSLDIDDVWCTRAGLESRFANIATCFRGYATDKDVRNYNICMDVIYRIMNDDDFFDEVAIANEREIEVAIRREVDMQGETRGTFRIIMACAIICDVNILHGIIVNDELTSYAHVSGNYEFTDTKKIKPDMTHMRHIYDHFKKNNPDGSVILHSMRIDTHRADIAPFMNFIRIHNPRNVEENIWNTICFFRSILTADEYDREMNIFYSILHEEGADGDNLDDYINAIKRIWMQDSFMCTSYTNIKEDFIYNSLKNSFKNPFTQQ